MRIDTNYIQRPLFYSTTNEEWKTKIPKDNWCLILISNKHNEELIDEIINESISKNVGYICGIGKMHDYIHNQSDEEYVARELQLTTTPKPKYHIMTVGDEDFEEGIWFGLMCTFNEEVEINQIQIIDADCTWKNKLIELLDKFEKGYLPEDK